MTLEDPGAAILLGVDLFCAIRLRYYGEHRAQAKASWQALPRDVRQLYIDYADSTLRKFAPSAPRQIVTGLGGKVIGSIAPGGAA